MSMNTFISRKFYMFDVKIKHFYYHLAVEYIFDSLHMKKLYQ